VSIEDKIWQRIESFPAGQLFMAGDFDDLGSPEATRLSLFRLEKSGQIRRLARGIYARPEQHETLGEILPSVEAVAEAIAQRDKIRTLPTGSYALNALGLSTQVPLKIVLLTDGTPRLIRVGRTTIKFKKTTPKNLAAKGVISSLVIQALKEIGNGLVREDEVERVIELLKKEKESDLRHDIRLAPVWIQKIMKKALVNDKAEFSHTGK
jgi:hypothetical protein